MLVNSGSEANDLAWRMATAVTGHRGGLCTAYAYHGITEATAALSPEGWFGAPGPDHIETWEPLDGRRSLRAGDHAACGDHGLGGRDPRRPAHQRRHRRPRRPRTCRSSSACTHEAGGLWIADEVQAGPRPHRRRAVVLRALRRRPGLRHARQADGQRPPRRRGHHPQRHRRPARRPHDAVQHLRRQPGQRRRRARRARRDRGRAGARARAAHRARRCAPRSTRSATRRSSRCAASAWPSGVELADAGGRGARPHARARRPRRHDRPRTATCSRSARRWRCASATCRNSPTRWRPRSRVWKHPSLMLPTELRQLIESGPLAHLSTINADGSPQVSVIWLGIDGDDLVTSHMSRKQLKLRNIERDPRVVLSLEAPREPGVFLAPHAVIKASARDRGTDRGRVGAARPPRQGLRGARRDVPRSARSGLHRPLHDREGQRRRPLGVPPAV